MVGESGASYPRHLAEFRNNATHHAEPRRVRQTWDYIKLLEHAALESSLRAHYALFLEDDVELCEDFFPLLIRALMQRD